MIGQLLCRFGRHRLIPGTIQERGEHAVVEKCRRQGCDIGRVKSVYRGQFPLRRG